LLNGLTMNLNSHDYDDIIDAALDRMSHKYQQYNYWRLLDPQVKAEMEAVKRKKNTAYQRKLRARKR